MSIEYYYPLLFPFTIASPLANYYPLIQVSDLVGINFYSFILILFNFAIYNIVQSLRFRQKFRYREIIVLFAVTTTFLAYGIYKISKVDRDIEKANKIKVGIVQGNFDFTEKTKNNYLYMTNEYKRLSSKLNSNPDLIIWPETSIQVFIPTDSHFLEYEGDILIPQKTSSYFLTGGLSYEIIDKYDVFDDENINHYNSAFLTDSNGKILGRFHKIKLLLFGEYLPLSEYIPSIKKLSPATGDYVPGTDLNILNIEKYKLNIATLICYEDIIPSFARRFKEKGANLLVNLTNDAWFGKTIAPFQHLLLSLPRAVENRTYLIRATNTGVSAIIDPVGRTLSETELFKMQSLESNVGIMDNGPTFYVKYGYRIYPSCLVLSIFYIGFFAITKKKESLKVL